jgi:4-amino-4-deoxy-L-arabinose transferase-like glycosyltransferase/Flp pilus assembly protein TadD
LRPLVDPISPLKKNPGARLFDFLAAAAVFLCGLGARVFYVLSLRETPIFTSISLDPAYYMAWASRIAAGDWLSGNQVFEQSPLYAYILAGIFTEAGEDLLTIRLVQAVAGAVTSLLVFVIARKLFGRPAGLAAGLLAAFYAPAIFHDGMIMKTGFAVLLTAAMTAALAHSDASRRGLLFTGGLLLGLSTLVRDNLILLAPLLALWLVVDLWLPPAIQVGRIKEAAVRLAIFTGGVLLAVLPVTARNLHVSGELVLLTSGGGEVFFIGNNPEADGKYSPPSFVRATSGLEHDDFRAEAVKRAGQGLTRREASNYWLEEGVSWIRENPGDWLRLTGRKLMIFLNGYELPDNQNFYHHRLLVPMLGTLPTWALVFPLAVAGFFLSLRGWRELLPLYVITAGYTATVLLFFNFARFRMPLMPIVLAFAAEGIIEIPALLRRSNWSWLAPPALLAGAGAAAIALAPMNNDALHRGQAAAQLSSLMFDSNRISESRKASREGIELLEDVYSGAGGTTPAGSHGVAGASDPGRPPLGISFYSTVMEAYSTRARIERAAGDESAALVWVQRAVTAAPDDALGFDTLLNAGEILLEAGRTDDAVRALARAREVEPGHLRLALLYAQTLHKKGKLREAVKVVDDALDEHEVIDPLTLADANYGLALLHRDLRNYPRMKFHLREALAKNPDHPRADWIRKKLVETDPGRR